jgi:hypothetical protein
MDHAVHSLSYSDIKNQLSGLPIGQSNNQEGVETAEKKESASNLAKLTSVFNSLHPRAKEIFWAIKPEGSTAQSLKKPVTKVDYTSVHKYLKVLLELKLVRRDESYTQHIYFRAVEFSVKSANLKNVSGASAEVAQESFFENEQNGCTSANHFTANPKIETETMDTSTSAQQVLNENTVAQEVSNQDTVSEVLENLLERMKTWANLRHQTMQIEQEVEKLGGKTALKMLKMLEPGIDKD